MAYIPRAKTWGFTPLLDKDGAMFFWCVTAAEGLGECVASVRRDEFLAAHSLY